MYRKRTKKQQLRGLADKLWYQKYLKGYCEVCGSSGGVLQGHHFFYRSSYGHLRYSPENHITLCRACHFLLHFKGNPDIQQRIIEKRGKKWYHKLRKEAFNKQKPSYQTIQYYQNIIEQLNDKNQ